MRSALKRISLHCLGAFVLVSVATALRAQPQEWSDAQTLNTRLRRILPLGGDRWVATGSLQYSGAHGIAAYNADGSPAWASFGLSFADGALGHAVLMQDSSLIVVGQTDHCDVLGPPSLVRRFAADGTLLWDTLIWGDGTYTPTTAARGGSERIALAGETILILDALDGSSITEFMQPDGWWAKFMHWRGDSMLYHFAEDGIRLLNLAGNLIAASTIAPMAKDCYFDGDTLYVLSDTDVHRFTADLVHIGSSAFQPGHYGWELHPDGSELYASTTSGLYRVADGIAQWLFPWTELPNTIVQGATVRNSIVATVTQWGVGGGYTHSVLRTCGLDGLTEENDTEVEALLDVATTWTAFAGNGHWHRFAQMTIRIVNHGTQPLSDVVVGSWTSGGDPMTCQTLSLREALSGLNLASGDTTVAWSGTHMVGQALPAFLAFGTFSICAAALAPNGKADRAPQDNYACESAEFTIGVDEHDAPRISLAPNPASDDALITGVAALGAEVSVSIQEASGRAVRTLTSVSSAINTLRLDLSTLSAGSYLITVSGPNGRSSARLVVLAR
jgi:hypothetical protein